MLHAVEQAPGSLLTHPGGADAIAKLVHFAPVQRNACRVGLPAG